MLQLEHLATGTYRLTRTLQCADGLHATLVALGSRPGEMLGALGEVDPFGQFRAGPGYAIALSYEFRPHYSAREAGPQPVILTGGVARVCGMTLTLTLLPIRGVAADLKLEGSPDSGPADIPEDLIAVLGWDWARLIRASSGWKSKLRLRGSLVRRSHSAAAALERAAAHLATTFAEPPRCFHDRWAAARWGVAARRSIPVLTLLVLAATVAALPHILVHPKPGIQVLLFDLPAVLIVLSFCLQELPRYEIPPLPRRSAALDWREPKPPN
jgi:hypothetical protein